MKIGNKGVAIWLGGTLLAAALLWAGRFIENGKPGLWTAASFIVLIFASTALFIFVHSVATVNAKAQHAKENNDSSTRPH